MPVQVKGLIETRKALKKFAPDLYEQMNKEIRVALKTITGLARKMAFTYEIFTLLHKLLPGLHH